METGNKEKKIGVALYEMLGTAFIMYALMMSNGLYLTNHRAPILITFAMTTLAWNVSGGHFNPTLTLGMYVAEKDFGGNLVTAGIMIVSQFAGAFLGLLLGYLTLLDPGYMKDLADDENVDYNASVPMRWLGQIIPVSFSTGASLPDYG